VIVSASTGVGAQNRLKTFPAYDRYQQMARDLPTASPSGAVAVTWTSDTTFEYSLRGSRYRFDVTTRTTTEIAAAQEPERSRRGLSGAPPERGRQSETAVSPDGARTAIYRDRNIWLSEEGQEIAVTSDGSSASRVKYGTASWVYGEELNQRSAMWWSPDKPAARLLPVRRVTRS